MMLGLSRRAGRLFAVAGSLNRRAFGACYGVVDASLGVIGGGVGG